MKAFIFAVLLTIGIQGCLAYLIAHDSEHSQHTNRDGG